MIDLQRIFDGFYNDASITPDRLHTYAIDNIKRMTINNPGGVYDQNIIDTQKAADASKASKVTKTSDTGTREGGTSEKDKQRDAIEKYLAIQIQTAVGAFGGKSQTGFIATYPNLMNSFYGATAADFDTNVQALIVKAGTYVAVLGVPFQDAITKMYKDYGIADDTHTTDTATVGSDIIYEQLTTQALADQLTDNVCDVAHNNRRSTTAMGLYFTEKLLFPVQTKQIKKGTPAAHSETLIPIVYSAGKRVKAHNKGATVLTIGMMLEGVKVGETITLAPNGEADKAFSYFFTNGDNLYVINEDAVNAGMYVIEIIS